jgi:hypothetical protein
MTQGIGYYSLLCIYLHHVSRLYNIKNLIPPRSMTFKKQWIIYYKKGISIIFQIIRDMFP